ALDGDCRNTRFLQTLQSRLRLYQRLRVNRTLVEEVARDEEGISPPLDGGIHHGQEGPREVVETLLQPILLIAQMVVRRVNEGRTHLLNSCMAVACSVSVSPAPAQPASNPVPPRASTTGNARPGTSV